MPGDAHVAAQPPSDISAPCSSRRRSQMCCGRQAESARQADAPLIATWTFAGRLTVSTPSSAVSPEGDRLWAVPKGFGRAYRSLGMDEGVCRICGATVATWELRSASGGGGCIRCEGSPLCSRCGHPRSEHIGVFAGSNRQACKIKVHAGDSLAVSRCGCAGYVATSGQATAGAGRVRKPQRATRRHGHADTPCHEPTRQRVAIPDFHRSRGTRVSPLRCRVLRELRHARDDGQPL